MGTIERRYDIDWLRVIAIGLLLIYHIAIVFQPWGMMIGFITSEAPLAGLWIPMAMLNVWRIPLLFFVSGMGVYFAMQKRAMKPLLQERTKRIFFPLVFGMTAIVPLHELIFQKYYGLPFMHQFNMGHLWFLGNIFCYVLVLSPLFFYLKKKDNGRIQKWLEAIFSHPVGFLIVPLFLTIEVLIVAPVVFEKYYMSWHGFFLGLLAFLFGFLFVYSGRTFWPTVKKWRWLFLVIALGFYLVRLILFQLKAENYLLTIESSFWIFTVLGFGYRYLNHPSKSLTYLSQAAYPVYIVHMAVLYLASALILPLSIPVSIQFLLIVIMTGVGCLALYELVIRRVGFLRPLFGLKSRKPKTEIKGVAKVITV